ncbi:MAG: low affinity iron permease family protein [Acidimicrobiales bacterium]
MGRQLAHKKAKRKKDSSRDRIASRTEHLPRASRLLYRIDHYSSLPMAAVVVGCLLVCAVAVGAAFGFPPGWISALEVASSMITLVMVVVIQHTQGREQTATQRKLDEVLRALPGAENGLMMLEQAPDDILQDIESQQRTSQRKALGRDLSWLGMSGAARIKPLKRPGYLRK